MRELCDIFQMRKEETALILENLKSMEKPQHRLFAKNTSIYKALVFIMLYNAVESIVYTSLLCLFDHIKRNCSDFRLLTPKMQLIYEKYYALKANTQIPLQEKHRITFEEYSNSVSTFSGNLDARKIREILGEYGICPNFHCDGEKDLLQVKTYRNKLAHGNYSFNDVGRNFCISDLEKIEKHVFAYLLEYVNLFSNFIDSNSYLQT